MADPTPTPSAGGKLTIQQELDKLSKACQSLKETTNKVRDKMTPILRREQAGKGPAGISSELAAQLREAKQASPMLESLLLQDEKIQESQNTLSEILGAVDF
jgi:hypothetical protein